ncbi:Anti-FecI sigma factor, FecR [uncultured Sphingopyxis sp.]|uniref:Anti-FecI sigma factor, FecR n=1 Tax=uncultured Sphingopyxis sp. TaxID=310581 RepID=A0A1Y5PS54_9SPHN|nr:FecR domain-containing protein [uncultured Sphingopyxis sp.]SBV32833.1 Anti-FecI sigma factor, FecR [uncultured Sphingopyxis sp.]
MIPENDNDGFAEQEERAAAWCLRIAERPLTSAEQADFDEWLAADERHAQYFEQMVAVWQGTDAIAELPGFLSLRAKALTTMESARTHNEQPSRSLTRRHAFGALTAFALTAGGGAWYWAESPDVYATAVGERRIVRLDDGSSVSLDAASRMLVSFTDERRAVTLERGRAKFDVAKDPLRPFTVTAGSQSVVAVGTSFSVELLKDQLRVLLFEGQVAVVPRAIAAANIRARRPASATTQLLPGQELVANLSSGAAEVLPVEAERSLGWEGGRVDFVDMPLADAVERMNRYAASPIVIGDAAAGRHLVNGVFDAGDTDSFVKGVTSLYPLSAHDTGDKILIKTVNSGTDKKKNSRS